MTWFLLLPFWAVMQVLAYLLAPFLPMFAVLRVGPLENNNGDGIGWRLPIWLAWMDTPDNSIAGDYGHQQRNKDSSLYWLMVLWLWRNPAVGFDAYVLSATLSKYDEVTVKGVWKVQDAPMGKEGYCYTSVGYYWNLVYINRFGNRCLKLDLGWQLKTFAEGNPLTPTARYAMSIRFPMFKTEL